MNVLIITEDFRLDQYIAKPVIAAMIQSAGKTNATILVCTDPLLGGYNEATKWERISEIIDLNRGMVDLFILVVDRDGDQNRRTTLDNLEKLAKSVLGDDQSLFAEHAWQEIEVWALEGLKLPKQWRWQDVRSERDANEHYFVPYTVGRRLTDEPGGGRRTLGVEAAKKYKKIRKLCPEDVANLEERIRNWIEQ